MPSLTAEVLEAIKANPGCPVAFLTEGRDIDGVVAALRTLDEAELIHFKQERTVGGFPYRIVYAFPVPEYDPTDY